MKVSGIIIVILISLILLKFVHIIVGISFFVIGMSLLVYYDKDKHKDKDKDKHKDKDDVYNNIIEYTKLLNKKCKIPYDLFYINMDKNIYRKNYMENQLNNIDVKFHRIKGVNGHNIKNQKIDYIDGIKFKNFFNDLSNGEIGCTLSHLKAIKTAYDYNLDIAIICEDDVFFGTCTLSPDIQYIISNAPKDWEIIQLITIPYKEDINNNTYIKRQYTKNKYYSSTCYCINKRGMEKILNYSYNYHQQTFMLHNTKITRSGQADFYIYDILNTYAYFPNLFTTYNNDKDMDSTIHTDHTSLHMENSINFLNTFNITKTLIDDLDKHKYIQSRSKYYNKIHFITFADGKNYKSDRIMKEAVNSNYFDVCKDMRYGINDFINKHDTFIKNNKRGYGYWIWKHKIILEEYKNLNDNDILIYSDSGNTICNYNFKMIDYLNILINGSGMLFFSVIHKEGIWSKMDTVKYIFPNENDDFIKKILNENQTPSGLMMFRKCKNTTLYLEEVASYSVIYRLINDDPSLIPNVDKFKEHRHDQTIFSLTKHKYKYDISYDNLDDPSTSCFYFSRLRT